jgi:hypothetical protein
MPARKGPPMPRRAAPVTTEIILKEGSRRANPQVVGLIPLMGG